MNRNEVIDVLSVVAAATRRTVGEVDVDVWQAVIGDCDKQQSLRAIRDHLRDRPGVWLEPGHIVERVRSFRRDALERESDAARDARQRALAAKVAEDAVAIGRGFSAERVFMRPSERPGGADPAMAVSCPWCKAKPTRSCVNTVPPMRPRDEPHPARRERAKGGPA